MTFLLKSNLHHHSPHFLEHRFEWQVQWLGEGQHMWQERVWLSWSGMLKCHPPCQEHLPVHGSPHVLHLPWVSVRARPEHTLVLSPPLTLTPTPGRIAFELEASLEDWQSSSPRGCRRASRLPSVGEHTSGSRVEQQNWEECMFSTCSLQTVLRPESHQKEQFKKAYRQELQGIMKEERLCLEISSVREEGNWE